MGLEDQPFNLRECVESAFDLLATRAAGKGLELAYLISEDAPVSIVGDVTRLRQILINSLRRQNYDVVLIDVQMPDMDGFKATRVIHLGWGEEERPRIIAMTANLMKKDWEACFETGMDDYIGKPIRVEELVAALERSAPLPGAPPAAHSPVADPEVAVPSEAVSVPPSDVLDSAALENLLDMSGGQPALVVGLAVQRAGGDG